MRMFIRYIVLLSFSFALQGCQAASCKLDKVRAEFLYYEAVTLSKPLTLKYVEQKQTVTFEHSGEKKTLPFGRINSDWEALKSSYRDGDCLIHFRTGEESWKSLYGREGYLLIREGKIIGIIITKAS